MSVKESLEFFPLFDPDTSADTPAVSATVGIGIAALGTPDALGGAGAVVLYTYSAAENAWGYVGVLTGSSIEGSQQVRGLGSSCVAVGNRIVVGAHGDASTPGRVFVLSPPYGTWSYTVVPVVTELARPEPVKGDRFGASIDSCTDGTHHYLAVGAPEAAAPPGTSGPGQVFVFRGLESKEPWITKTLANPNPEGTATDRFGAAIAVGISKGDSAGSLTVAVGAPGAFEGQGAVFTGRTLLDDPDGSKFEFDSPLVPSFPDASDEFRTADFGSSVALDGDILAVGSPSDPNFELQVEGTGAVWVYQFRDGSFVTDGGAALAGQTADAKFGSSVSFARSAGGDPATTGSRQLIVGAPGARRSFTFAGEGDGPAFSQEAELETVGGKEGDRFGAAVSGLVGTEGASFLCAAPGNPKGQVDGGGYLFSTADSAPTWMRPPRLLSDSPLRWAGLPLDWWKKWTPQVAKYIG